MTAKIDQTTVLLSDLEDVYATLMSVQTFLEAQDTAKSQLNYFETVRYSPLTQDVQQRTTRIKGIIDDYIVKQHHAARALPTDPPDAGSIEVRENGEAGDQERLEPLPPNPMGNFYVERPPSPLTEGAERVE